MIKQYNNRKQMLRDFGVTDMDIMDNVYNNKVTYADHRLEFIFDTIKVVATSAGTYGVNGAIIKATKKDYNVPTYFGINKRSTLLFELI